MNLFHEKQYQPVKDLVNSQIVDIVTQYALLNELNSYQPELDGEQVPGSHSVYGDLLMETLLLSLKSSIEYVTKLELLPTYSYYRVYRPGQDLKPHTDRESCEISATISFGQDYKTMQGDYKWPMFIKGTPISLCPGDGIIYKGIEAEHWREQLTAPKLSYHVQGFFHYVDANGPYADWALDKREYIGQSQKKKNVGKPYIFTTI